jgi:hypothetical protein
VPASAIFFRLCTLAAGSTEMLANDGFVTRTRCEQDGRVIYVDLTTTARNVLKKIDDPLMAMYRERLGHLRRTAPAATVRAPGESPPEPACVDGAARTAMLGHRSAAQYV